MKHKAALIAVVITLALMVVLSFIPFVHADVSGAESVTTISTSRRAPLPANEVDAQAGNITELFINATTVTQSWQGYYGNVTGFVTLQDGLNNTLYDWALAEPNGEIYAVNQTVDFASVDCFNYTATGGEINLSTYEETLGIGQTDVDGVNETFNSIYNGTFYAGLTKINASTYCYSTDLYQNSSSAGDEFVEVLLTDGQAVIYTALLENNVIGFDNRSHDFQMIVGEDGHTGNNAVTPYYFYVELE